MRQFVHRTITRIIEWKARNGLNILRVSLGIVFFWFGFIKFFPGVSTAEKIASDTVLWLSRGNMPADLSMPVLGTWECLIGLGLLLRKWMTFTLVLLYCQMMGTLLPLIIFRDQTWTQYLFVPTLLGQYIIKNAVLISAAMVLGATIRGGGLSAHPMVTRLFRKRVRSQPVG